MNVVVRRFAGFLAWLGLPVACHLGFSWIGYNPTDEGWLQSVALRIAHGEVPHRDFIFARPALSAVLNIPIAIWGGEYTLWLARLAGWMSIAAIAGIWTALATRPGVEVASAPARSGSSERYFMKYALYCCAVFLIAHTFPVMAWHSLDGMLWCSFAVLLACRGTRASMRLAYVSIGIAALCRQNFACFVPVLMIALPRQFQSLDFFWSALPPLAYLLAMLALGAAGDFVAQIGSTGGWFFEVAVVRYFMEPRFLVPAILGVLVAIVLRQTRTTNTAMQLAPGLILAATCGALVVLLWRGDAFSRNAGFGLFGFALGLAPLAFASPFDRTITLTGLGLAWTTAISVGFNRPSLASGILFVLLWRLLQGRQQDLHSVRRTLRSAVPACAALLLAAAFAHARLEYPYRDRSARELRRDVGEVLPGGARLRTNEVTHAALADLDGLRARLRRDGRVHAVLTDFSSTWLGGPERNPLPVEWAQATELANNQALIQRVLDSLAALPDGARIVVQRYRTAVLARGLSPVSPDSSYFAVQEWVRANCRACGETPFFEIYLPPGAPRTVESPVLPE